MRQPEMQRPSAPLRVGGVMAWPRAVVQFGRAHVTVIAVNGHLLPLVDRCSAQDNCFSLARILAILGWPPHPSVPVHSLFRRIVGGSA